MAANNWTECPECKRRIKESISNFKDELEKLYGKISMSEYHAKLLELKHREIESNGTRETVREDYEIGLVNGRLIIDYAAKCTALGCNFLKTFKYNGEKI